MIHAARAAFTPSGVLRDVAVETNGSCIADVRRWHRGDPEPLDGMLVPGLVNAHTHLELSWCGGRLPCTGAGFTPWVRALFRVLEGEDSAHREECAVAAAKALREQGVAAVADVCGRGDAARWLAAAELNGVVFHELIGFDGERVDRAVRFACKGRRFESGRSVWPTPHAAYSTSAAIIGAGGPGLRSIHVAEDPGENELTRWGTGPHADLLAERGVVPWSGPPPGTSVLGYLESLGVIRPSALLVHAVFLEDGDCERIRRGGASVCLCPRSNLAVSGTLADVPRLVEAGIPLALGTDSLASAPDLDVLAEIPVLARQFPGVDPSIWLDVATRGGADALGLPLGRLQVGLSPGLLLLHGVDDPLALTERPPARSWIVLPGVT